MLYCRLFPAPMLLRSPRQTAPNTRENFRVRFILRTELNANPLASELDPFGRIILYASPRENLCARFGCHTFHNFTPSQQKGSNIERVRVGSKSRSIYQKSLHQKLCNQSAKLLFFPFSLRLNEAPKHRAKAK